MASVRRNLAHLAVISKFALKKAKSNALLKEAEKHQDRGGFLRKLVSSVMFLVGGNVIYVFGYQDRKYTEVFESRELAEKRIRELELFSVEEKEKRWGNLWEMIRYNYLTDLIYRVSVSGFAFRCQELRNQLKSIEQMKVENDGSEGMYSKLIISEAIKCRELTNFKNLNEVSAKDAVFSSIVPISDYVIYKAPFLMDEDEFALREINKDHAKIEMEHHSLDSIEEFMNIRHSLQFIHSPYHPLALFNLNERSIFKKLISESASTSLGVQIKITYRKRIEWIELLTGVTELFLE
jgi:hypothetical protein